MPRYSYECRHCGDRQEIVRSIKDHTRTIPCEGCGQEMQQELGFAHVIPDIEPYRSVVTGERIRGRAHHRAHLKQHGLIERGNDPVRERKPKPLPPLHEDIKRAIAETRRR
jgi:putative FmdB family regulatory protein